ncbi:MAG: L,D-transpeptidase family protein [Candidatus Dormibacteraeota bacterium]|nr:L,D-transpeptidase family protein [Candidatus Dormibacteraeota bacterium]
MGLVAVYAFASTRETNQAYAGYQGQQQQTQAAIQRARAQGFTDQDLRPITSQYDQLTLPGGPFWPGARASFYQDRSAALTQLRQRLHGYLPQVVGRAKGDVNQQVAGAVRLIQENAQQGGDVAPFQDRLNKIQQSAAASSSIREVRELGTEAQQVAKELATQAATLKQENAAIQQAATGLLAQTQDVNALRGQASATVTAENNEASLAAYESKAGRFKPIDTVMAAYDRMQFFTSKLAAPDLNSVAFGAAAEQRYGGQIHNLLATNLGPKHLVVSFQDQHVWAYQNGQQVMDTPVTTGIRGNTTYGTDFGPMKMVHIDHPWKMHSPWPPGSPLYYPDTVVQYASFFTNSGESFHDASWEPDSALGPGSQNNDAWRTHGCIHVPLNLAQWIYSWAQVGTPVDVLPYDGSPVSNQLSQMTTDNNGNPLNPA